MVCFHPISAFQVINPPEGAKKIVFRVPNRPFTHLDLPCGGCVGCRLERSRQWAVRCHHEASLHDNNAFVTLTYNQENLPENGSVSVRELQLFMKRLRKKYGPGIRHYACGEYGDELGRPHYHLILFNFYPPDPVLYSRKNHQLLYTSKSLDKIWGKGFTTTGSVTFQSAAYVSRYIMKKINGEAADQHYETSHASTGEITQRTPEFTIMSKNPGIGKAWYDKYKKDVYDYDFVVINNKKVRAPRYYDRLFEMDDPKALEALKKLRIENAVKHHENNTPERLAVRETIQNAKMKKLPRTYED